MWARLITRVIPLLIYSRFFDQSSVCLGSTQARAPADVCVLCSDSRGSQQVLSIDNRKIYRTVQSVAKKRTKKKQDDQNMHTCSDQKREFHIFI